MFDRSHDLIGLANDALSRKHPVPAGLALVEPLNDDRREHPDNPAQKIRHPRDVDEMVGAVAAIIDEDPTSVNDIKLEAGAFLCLARQSTRVDRGFVQRVVRFQNADGGWGMPVEGAGDPDGSSWHSTILALMILLCVSFPGAESAAEA
jgi:hypothetical protein